MSICLFERPPGGDITGLTLVARKLAGRTTFNGNVRTVETLIRGTPAAVEREVLEILAWIMCIGRIEILVSRILKPGMLNMSTGLINVSFYGSAVPPLNRPGEVLKMTLICLISSSISSAQWFGSCSKGNNRT